MLKHEDGYDLTAETNRRKMSSTMIVVFDMPRLSITVSIFAICASYVSLLPLFTLELTITVKCYE